MNDAHFHLVVNHFPIIGLFFGVGILLFGIIKKNTTVTSIGYVIFIFCMIMSKVSMFSGEKAEDTVENLGISHEIIHEHEEAAEGFMKVMYLLGIASIIGLYINTKKQSKSLIMSFLILTISIVGLLLSKSVATTGGEIRHTEIRESATATNGQSTPDLESEEHED